jgi:hypothetical protein
VFISLYFLSLYFGLLVLLPNFQKEFGRLLVLAYLVIQNNVVTPFTLRSFGPLQLKLVK